MVWRVFMYVHTPASIVYVLYVNDWAEEERIWARGWRTMYLASRMKNDVFRRKNPKRRVSALLWPVHGQYTAKYVVFHFRAELRSSSSARQDTTFFIHVPRYVVLHPRTEIRRSSCSHRDKSFFILAPRFVILQSRAEIRSSSTQPSMCTLLGVFSFRNNLILITKIILNLFVCLQLFVVLYFYFHISLVNIEPCKSLNLWMLDPKFFC